jgi:hypothetical protein
MHENHLFARTGALTLDGFSGSGADWLARLKPHIEDDKTVVVSPHKIWSLLYSSNLAEHAGFVRFSRRT